MSDELTIQPQVQQKQSSPMPYVVGGALGGGLVGGATAYYTTKPKYASHEDIIKDSKDNFEKAAKEVISEEAEQTKAINAYQAGVDAGNKWENDKKAFVEANKEGAVPELASDHELMKKKAEIENSIKTIEGNTTASKTVTKEPMALLRSRLKELKKADNALQELQANNASKEEINNARNAVKAAEAKYDSAVDEVVKNTKFKDTKVINGVEVKVTDAEVEKMKEAYKKELKGYQAEYMAAWDKFSVKHPVSSYVKAQTQLAAEQKTVSDAIAEIEKASGYKLKADINNKKKYAKEIDVLRNIESKKADVLRDMLNKYNVASKSGAAPVSLKELLRQYLIQKMGGTVEPKVLEDEVKKYVDGLSEKELKLLNGKEVTKENLEQAIKESEARLETIKNADSRITHARTNIDNYNKIIANETKNARNKYGKAAYFNENGEICVKGKPVEKAPQFKAPELKTSAELPKEVTYQTKGSGVDTKALNEAKAQLADVEGKITEARNALPKPAGMSEEDAIKKFIEKNGTKEEAMKKAFGEDVKALLEKKIPNKKLAAYIGGGAAILAALGYMIAPKHSEDIA